MHACSTVLAGALLCAPTPAAGAAAPPHGFRVGEPVPDLVLPAAADAAPRSLADFRGEKLVLHVFASW